MSQESRTLVTNDYACTDRRPAPENPRLLAALSEQAGGDAAGAAHRPGRAALRAAGGNPRDCRSARPGAGGGPGHDDVLRLLPRREEAAGPDTVVGLPQPGVFA